MGLFAPPPVLDPMMRRMLAELRALDAWAAQFPAALPKPPPLRRENLRRDRAKATSVPPAVGNGSDPAADELAAMDRAIYGSKGHRT